MLASLSGLALCRPPPLVPAHHHCRHRLPGRYRAGPGPPDLRRVRFLARPGQSGRPRPRQPYHLHRHPQNLTRWSSLGRLQRGLIADVGSVPIEREGRPDLGILRACGPHWPARPAAH